MITIIVPIRNEEKYIRECISLSKIDDYDVRLIVADGLGNEEKKLYEVYKEFE